MHSICSLRSLWLVFGTYDAFVVEWLLCESPNLKVAGPNLRASRIFANSRHFYFYFLHFIELVFVLSLVFAKRSFASVFIAA